MLHTFQSERTVTSQGRSLAVAIVAAGVLVLGGCTSAPQAPNASLQAAEQAITIAEQVRAAEYAAVELGQARSKLAAAKAAVETEEMTLAKRFADESLVDAQLASAKASELQAKKINEDMRESTSVLQQEMDRNAGTRR